jgi:uncharacterized protein
VINDPLFYVLGVAGYLVIGFSKAGFGTGIGSLVVPLLALTIPVPQAAAIVLPALLFTDIITLWMYRKHCAWSQLRIILPGIFIGSALGYVTFRHLNDDAIRLMIGAMATGLSVNAFVQAWRQRNRAPVAQSPSWIKGGFWSSMACLTSFVANAGGPPLAVYLLPLRLDRMTFVGTTTVYWAIANYLKIIPYWHLGQFSPENLWAAAVLLPVAPIGIWCGFALLRRLNDTGFYRWIYALLFVTGVKLLWDGTAGILAAS